MRKERKSGIKERGKFRLTPFSHQLRPAPLARSNSHHPELGTREPGTHAPGSAKPDQ